MPFLMFLLILSIRVSNSNGVNSNPLVHAFIASKILVSNSNGVNSNDIFMTFAGKAKREFQTPTE